MRVLQVWKNKDLKQEWQEGMVWKVLYNKNPQEVVTNETGKEGKETQVVWVLAVTDG